MAEEIGLPVIPVLAEKVRSPLWLRHLQVLDFCTQTNWPALIAALPLLQTNNPTVTADAGSKLFVIPSKPIWASTSGTDQYGFYADLEFKGVVQRFRSIQAGSFMMGSPEEEEGRFDDETLYPVTLTKDFWLADTACTQAFWQAVMGSNPAHFTGSLHNPVEQVSWDDVQGFINKTQVA